MNIHIVGIVLVVAAALFALALIYPYVIYPVLLRLLPELPSQSIDEDPVAAGHFAVLFSAFNEERIAREKVENLKQLTRRHPSLEIRIYDDGSTDRTREIFSELGADVVIAGSGRAGKATGMAKLVKATDRPILLFTDANVLLAEDIIEKSAPYFADTSVGGICGHLKYEADEQTATQAAGGAYWRLEENIKRLESRSGSVMGGDGSIFVMRREVYPTVPVTAQDDFTATMSVVFKKKRLIVADDVVVHERLVARSRDEYHRKVRIAARAVHTHLTMRDQLRRMSIINRWKYASHKVIRWCGAFFLAAGLLTGVIGVSILNPTVGLATLMCAVVAGLMVSYVPRLGAFREVVVAIVATGQGVLLALSGSTFATWTPPQSR